MQMELSDAEGCCCYCGGGLLFCNAPYNWQGRLYCGVDCTHNAGDRTNCELAAAVCSCTAHVKLERKWRACQLARQAMRLALVSRRPWGLTAAEFDMPLDGAKNLPYEPDEDKLQDFFERRAGDHGDDWDPGRRALDESVRHAVAADTAASVADVAKLVDVAAAMVQHSDANAKRRRVDSQKDKECEDLRKKYEDLQQKNEDLQQRLDASERRCLELEEKRSGCSA